MMKKSQKKTEPTKVEGFTLLEDRHSFSSPLGKYRVYGWPCRDGGMEWEVVDMMTCGEAVGFYRNQMTAFDTVRKLEEGSK